MLKKKFPLLRPADDGSDLGGGAAVAEDRGDLLPDDMPAAVAPALPADTPEVKTLVAALAAPAAPEPDDEDGEGQDDPTDKNARIPLSRHKTMLEKERERTAAALAEVAELKKRGAFESVVADTTAELKAMETEVSTLEAEYTELVTDGKAKEAAAVMAKIRATERTMADTRADLKIQASVAVAAESSRYQTALARIEAAYPVLNPDAPDYDSKTEARVSRLSAANQAAGMTSTAALQDAVEAILGSQSAAQERATTVTPRPDAAVVAAARKAAAVAKTVAAVGDTPASLNKVGANSDADGASKITAERAVRMSQADFAALNEKLLSDLRGDTL